MTDESKSDAKTLVARLRRQHPTPLEREAADAIEELTAALRTIRNNCDAPHWSADRKHRVRLIAHIALTKYGASNG